MRATALRIVAVGVFVGAVASACVPAGRTGKEPAPPPPVIGGPARIVLEAPTLDELNPFADARVVVAGALQGTLVVTVGDPAAVSTSVTTELDLAAADLTLPDAIPFGSALDVLVALRSPANVLIGLGQARGVAVGPDADTTVRVLKPVAYIADRGWPGASLGSEDAAVHVVDLSQIQDQGNANGAFKSAPRIAALRGDLDGIQDLRITADGRRIVIAHQSSHVRVLDTLDDVAVGADLDVGFEIDDLLPLAAHRFVAVPIQNGGAGAGAVVDVDTGTVDALPLAMTGFDNAKINVFGSDVLADGSAAFLAVQVSPTNQGAFPALMKLDFTTDPPTQTAVATSSFDTPGDVRILDDFVYVGGSTSTGQETVDGRIEIHSLDLSLSSSFALPPNDTLVSDMLVHPSGGALLVNTGPIFGGGPRNGCCQGEMTVDVGGTVLAPQTTTDFGMEVASTGADGIAVGGLTNDGNNNAFAAELTLIGADPAVFGPYLKIDLGPSVGFYLDHVSGIAIPFGRRL